MDGVGSSGGHGVMGATGTAAAAAAAHIALCPLPPTMLILAPHRPCALAGLGVIHRGNVGRSRTIMAPYLPAAPGGSTPSPFSGAVWWGGAVGRLLCLREQQQRQPLFR